MGLCTAELSLNMESTCVEENVFGGGNEDKAWLIPRNLITFTPDVTNPSLLTGFTIPLGGNKLFTLNTVVRDIDSGHDGLGVEAGQALERYTHAATTKFRDNTYAAVENIGGLKDMVLITELIGKGTASDGNGTFEVRGVSRGLYKTSDARRLNSDNGARIVELGTSFDQYEIYPHYTLFATDYATTKALLVAAETETGPIV